MVAMVKAMIGICQVMATTVLAIWSIHGTHATSNETTETAAIKQHFEINKASNDTMEAATIKQHFEINKASNDTIEAAAIKQHFEIDQTSNNTIEATATKQYTDASLSAPTPSRSSERLKAARTFFFTLRAALVSGAPFARKLVWLGFGH